MKYENADRIFPKELLIEMRHFMPEGYVYISPCTERKAWGSISGHKTKLHKRNRQIFLEYQKGKSVSEIAKERYLSESAIYKIIRKFK